MDYMKTLTITVLIAGLACLLVISTGNMAMAKVAGQCGECHTMHNSQDGSALDPNGPKPFLIKTTKSNICVGCHTVSGNKFAPQIDLTASFQAIGGGATVYVEGMSAGGTVLYDANDADVHNIDDITLADAAIGLTPPGFDETEYGTVSTTYSDGADWSVQLTCAGVYGCHGDKDELAMNDAIAGAHHGDANSPIGGAYRFLAGIEGEEDPTAEGAEGSKRYTWDENKYSSGTTGTETDTISALCGQCHGKFHDQDDTGGPSSPFTRHPSDLTIDNTRLAIPGEGANPYVVPIGYTDYPTYGIANRKGLLCISCHLSHGSLEEDILRFDYTQMSAGSTGVDGCLACHSRQR